MPAEFCKICNENILVNLVIAFASARIIYYIGRYFNYNKINILCVSMYIIDRPKFRIPVAAKNVK